jgi:hypothetical protein
MGLEYFWRNDDRAAEFKASARSSLALAAPPKETKTGQHAFGEHSIGHAGHVGANDLATGFFRAVDVKTGEVLVFTHHSPHESDRPKGATTDLGQRERNDLAFLSVPAHPATFSIGSAGPANQQLTPAQLAVVEKACANAEPKLPAPMIVGRDHTAQKTAWAALAL